MVNDSPRSSKPSEKSESGIALFMVISAMTVLSVLVTEFTYVAQVNRKLAFDGLDQIKAHYLAKSGLKLSLLRLKAYQNVKSVIGNIGSGGGDAAVSAMLPKAIIEKIWSFPFMYPIPSIPGLGLNDREALEKFQKSSSLEGNYSALIESESSKFNLNSILAPFAAKPTASPSPSPTATPPPTEGRDASDTGQTAPMPAPSFSPEAARQSLFTHLNEILQDKYKADPDFADEYRNFRLEDLIDAIAGWSDRTYERKNLAGREAIPSKRGPFYSLGELHMVQGMDDGLFALFAPSLTVATTPGINVNTMQEPTLKALLPRITEEETKEFFKFRDNPTEDHLFKKPEDFFKYIQSNLSAFRNDPSEVQRYQKELESRGVYIVTEETHFKITVQASVGQTTRTIEAWVSLTTPTGPSSSPVVQTPGKAPTTPVAPPAGAVSSSNLGPGGEAPIVNTDTGLRVTFMRIL